jgi:hypothetical protein
MRKVLLTTTALVMTAGVAAAEITFSGTGGIALVDDNGAQAAAEAAAGRTLALTTSALAAQDALNNANAALAKAQAALTAGTGTAAAVTAATTARDTAAGKLATAEAAIDGDVAADQATARAANSDMRIVSYYDMDVTASASTDMGIDFALSFDMGGGEKVDYDDDDMVEVQGATVGHADVSATYNGWTLAVDQNGIDNAYTDDAAEQDMSLSGSIGGIALTVTADLDNDHNSFNASYTTAGGITATVSGTNDDEANGDASAFSVAYKMGDLSMKYSSADEANNAEDDQSINFTYALDAITLSYTTIAPGKDGDFGDEWDAKVSYAAGAMSASLNIDEADATTMIAEYDLGGATAFAAMHDKAGTNSDLTVFGVNFSF